MSNQFGHSVGHGRSSEEPIDSNAVNLALPAIRAAFADGVRAPVLTGGIVEIVGAVLGLRYATRRAEAVPMKEDCHA